MLGDDNYRRLLFQSRVARFSCGMQPQASGTSRKNGPFLASAFPSGATSSQPGTASKGMVNRVETAARPTAAGLNSHRRMTSPHAGGVFPVGM